MALEKVGLGCRGYRGRGAARRGGLRQETEDKDLTVMARRWMRKGDYSTEWWLTDDCDSNTKRPCRGRLAVSRRVARRWLVHIAWRHTRTPRADSDRRVG